MTLQVTENQPWYPSLLIRSHSQISRQNATVPSSEGGRGKGVGKGEGGRGKGVGKGEGGG